jgi:hypothetical protein
MLKFSVSNIHRAVIAAARGCDTKQKVARLRTRERAPSARHDSFFLRMTVSSSTMGDHGSQKKGAAVATPFYLLNSAMKLFC